MSDGAEDEYILPIIQSRLKINSIQRVNVKQSKQLEDTYYRIIKLLDEDKVKKQFFLPIALILIVWAIFAMVIIAVSLFYAYNNTFNQYQQFLDVLVLKFLAGITWGIVAAGLLAAFGRVTDLYIREKKILWSYWVVPFSLFAFGFIGSMLFDTFGQVIWEFRNGRGFIIDPFFTLT